MELICERRYGEPKLIKPKCCNNKTLLGNVPFIYAKRRVACNNKLYKDNNTYYLLVRDWFSQSITRKEAVELGLLKELKQKFCYDDGEQASTVVLRNEAIISFTRADWYYGDYRYGGANAANNLVIQLMKTVGIKNDYPSLEWERMFERCLTLIGTNILDTAAHNSTKMLRDLV